MTHFKYIIIISFLFFTGCASFVKQPELKEHVQIDPKNYEYNPPEYVNKKLKDIGEITPIIEKKPGKYYLAESENGNYQKTNDKKEASLIAFTYDDFKLLTRILSQRRYYYNLLNVYADDRKDLNQQANYEMQQCRTEVYYKDLKSNIKDLRMEEIKVQLYNSKEFVRYYQDVEKIERLFAPVKTGILLGLGLYGIAN